MFNAERRVNRDIHVDNPLKQSMEFTLHSKGGDVVRIRVDGYVNPLNAILALSEVGSPMAIMENAKRHEIPLSVLKEAMVGEKSADELFELAMGKSVEEVRAEAAATIEVPEAPDSPAGLDES